MNKVLLVLFLATASSTFLFGQGIIEEPAITKMVDNFVEYNETHQLVRGWRVQILVTTERRLMETTRKEFEAANPNFKINYRHDNPFYHLKTGAFLTQSAARPFLRQMQETYSSAFLVSDQINMSEVLLYQ